MVRVGLDGTSNRKVALCVGSRGGKPGRMGAGFATVLTEGPGALRM